MPLSALLIRRLEEILGPDAAEDLVSHLDRGDEFRADLAELRHETQLGFAKGDARFATVDQKLDGMRVEIRDQIGGATARLLKWSFVFWVSAVGAIAGLAGVLR